MRDLLAIAALLLSTPAFADVIECSFTEGFAATAYDTSKNTLEITYKAELGGEVLNGVSFQITGPGRFELLGSDAKVIQRLRLSFNGDDGMSDLVYPFEVHWVAKGMRGGCTSNRLKASKRQHRRAPVQRPRNQGPAAK